MIIWSGIQDILSQLEIYVALKDSLRENVPAFNVADEDELITWAYVWPGICRQFGLAGVCPRDGEQHQAQSMEEFVKLNRSSWNLVCDELSLRKDPIDVQGWAHTHNMLVDYDFDRWYDISRSRAGGFTESIDTAEAYKIAFERMAAAGIIPREYLE
ncbi:uncharacterized protein KD926_005582 [Aspergillus affinis]|uniref:uncharacterized protein n=1 Tax=Aspergillus affinis TaxID=1070780 RepID=UPI0022FE6D97|nr:uncharacterized protein KD926_005582 [Aspergillus affinis]KAI9034781.1 hypothetical protein KD926_005582 [Aspergillus affinis]